MSNYTLLEFNEISLLDYYRDSISGADQDAVVARFKLPQYVGVNETNIVKDIQQLLVYPNPTLGLLNVMLPNPSGKNDLLELYDAQGRLIHSERLENRSRLIVLNLPQVASGMYIVRYKSTDNILTQTFIKE